MKVKEIMKTKEYKKLKDLDYYQCNCAICGRMTTTQKNTANEGICYKCRCC